MFCSACGCGIASSQTCNKTTGVCDCRDGVHGTSCTECEVRYILI